jgi:hypothetical protein
MLAKCYNATKLLIVGLAPEFSKKFSRGVDVGHFGVEGEAPADGASDRAPLGPAHRVLFDQPLDALHAEAVAALQKSLFIEFNS